MSQPLDQRPAAVTITPNQTVRRCIGVACAAVALGCPVGVVLLVRSGGGSAYALAALLMGSTAFYALVARQHLRPSRFAFSVGLDRVTLTDAAGQVHEWERSAVGAVHLYQRMHGKAPVPYLTVRGLAGGELVTVVVETGVDVEAIADAAAATGIYATRQPTAAIGVVGHNPAGRPDIVAVSPERGRFVRRSLLLGFGPMAAAMVAAGLLGAAGHDGVGLVLLLIGFAAPFPGVFYARRRAYGLTFSAAGLHPGAGLTLTGPIAIERIRGIVLDENWLGTAVAVDLDDGRRLPFPRQVGLRADDVRLAAMTVGIPTT